MVPHNGLYFIPMILCYLRLAAAATAVVATARIVVVTARIAETAVIVAEEDDDYENDNP